MERLTKEIILDLLHENRKKIKCYGVKKLTLFGSFARDEQTQNSDVDLLVEFDKKHYDVYKHIQLVHFLEKLFGREVDLAKPEILRDFVKETVFEGSLYEAKI